MVDVRPGGVHNQALPMATAILDIFTLFISVR